MHSIITKYKPVKRFQMKSNGCRDVQHTGLQITQTRRNTGKQGAQTIKGHSIGTSSQASLHQWLHCMSNNQAIFFQFL